MGSEWPEIALTDAYSISSGLSKPAKDFGSGFPFLAFKDVFYNTFVPAELTQLVQSSEKEQAACSIKRGDVFLTRTSETMDELGMSAVALKDYEKATFNGFTKRLRPKAGNGLHPEYVAYFLRSPGFRAEMMAFSTMSTRASLNNDMIGRLKISVPPLDIQRSIASILKILDDKIELNRQMNITLEAMAQALFKSWFVDFDPVIDNALAAGNPIPEELAARAERRAKAAQQQSPEHPHTLPAAIRQQFPDRFVFTETMGWVPEGWEVHSLAEMVSLIIDHRGKTPKKLGGDWSPKGHPAISAKNIKNGRIVRPDSIRYVDNDLYLKWMKSPLHRGDIALTSEAPLGELYYFSSKVDYLLSQRLFGIRANTELTDGCFLYFWLRSERGQSELQNRATGTTVVGIRQSELLKTLVLSPPQHTIKQFSNIAEAQLSCIDSNENQISALIKLRDTLLPKLLSGQLRIPEAEKLLAEAL